jgi:putative sulfotransferase
MNAPTFVVGTGRCGSTMLSNMLREHPKVLSLSEFFSFVSDGARVPEALSPEPMDGAQFWRIVTGCAQHITFAMQHGIASPEILYRYDDPSARFPPETGVPAILLTTLPHLTDDHDALFELLREEVNTWLDAMIGEHYRHLFAWLSAHFGKRLWVERSGGSYLVAEQLMRIFPEPRFVHMVRDGRDAALSNREHPGFRLAMIMISLQQCLGVDPLEDADRTHLDRVPAELLPFLPERFDVDAFRAHRFPLPFCGQLWAHQIGNGARALRMVPPERLLTLRYEDFFIDPTAQLNRLAAFLGDQFVDEAWSARCAAMVRKPRSTWRDLPEEDARALTEACRPGFELLRDAGVHYDLSATQ